MSTDKYRVNSAQVTTEHGDLIIGETHVYCLRSQAEQAVDLLNHGYQVIAVLDEGNNVLEVVARD